ncbi:unnamed protein product [Cuscuta campestris]|uniref:Uncharacterized protein n=1 Tax=Cuscuta campestris TaxID=132261 RepID=A0A484LU07_9ASTE|nr:unnamed protein product [Cuscuta campestris]
MLCRCIGVDKEIDGGGGVQAPIDDGLLDRREGAPNFFLRLFFESEGRAKVTASSEQWPEMRPPVRLAEKTTVGGDRR